ncbi:extracellular solute-binding protein [Paenibacillus filicis]|uniref:Extracellular solute-binding protein n=1 Tax=Paenibacillus gyeongsangnamensis TaxID=3388067 RepID=A0ABT4QCW0_9BACL|nr:extracellular solute-binding protein [Paenibacillus filicis]MCZ8514694.1 extracellular solute-binding protein [Paenibacillus filicis]
MNISRKASASALALALLASALQGCSGGAAPPKDDAPADVKKINTDPVTLTVWASMSDELFQKLVAEPVKLKYPHISLQMVSAENKIPDLIASGNVPDIITDAIASIPKYQELNLTEELTPYVKAFNMDLGRISPVVLDTVRKASGDGKLSALPISGNVVMMYYNKDIFDRFSVPYPKDGMTWDEVYDLARKLTKSEGGVQYRGFDFQDSFQFTANQLSLSVVDGAAKKAIVNNEKWKRMFENYARFFAIPGNEVNDKTYGQGQNQFLKDKTLAMYVTSSIFSKLPEAVKGGLNFDVVTLPSFAEAPGVTTQVDGGIRFISTTSRNKDQAFLALSAMLSDEAQKQIARNGNTSVLTDAKIMEEFGKDADVLKDRNRLGFIRNKPAPPSPSITRFDSSAYSIVRSKFKKMVLTGTDVNTILRETDELVNQAIADASK